MPSGRVLGRGKATSLAHSLRPCQQYVKSGTSRDIPRRGSPSATSRSTRRRCPAPPHARRHPRRPAPSTPTPRRSTTASALTYADAPRRRRGRRTLSERGIGRGDRVGVRMPSGTAELYVAILGVLAAGAAYVPVDVDDPDERAETVFGGRRRGRSATDCRSRPRGVAAAAPGGARCPTTTPGSSSPPARPARPRASRSRTAPPPRSSTPRRGCSCRTRRSARATGCWPGCRSRSTPRCEEMWLAWRHGACLVPGAARAGAHRHGPRALAGRAAASPSSRPCRRWRAVAGRGARRRAAADLRRRGVPARARRAAGRRRAARSGTPTARPRRPSSRAPRRLTGDGPVRIGLPLDGWDLAVVDPDGRAGRRGRDRRADHRRRRPGPLPRPGQGRREVRRRCRRWAGTAPTAAATSCGPTPRAWSSSAAPTTRSSSAAAGSSSARSTRRCWRCPASPARRPPCARPRPATRCSSATSCREPTASTAPAPPSSCASALPAALVPLLAPSTTLPTRTSGKVDRDALPWPLPASEDGAVRRRPGCTAQRLDGGLAGPTSGIGLAAPVGPGRRLLRARRQQPRHRGPAGPPLARALPTVSTLRPHDAPPDVRASSTTTSTAPARSRP